LVWIRTEIKTPQCWPLSSPRHTGHRVRSLIREKLDQRSGNTTLDDIPSNPGFIHDTILLEIATKTSFHKKSSLVSLISHPPGTELPYINNFPRTKKHHTFHPNLSPGELGGGGEMIHTLELVHHTMDVLSSVGKAGGWEMAFRTG